MGEIVTTITTTLAEMIGGSATAIGDGVVGLLLVENGGEYALSETGLIIFTLFGISMAVGLMYVVFNLVTRR